jgi:hypothetical protein
MGTNAAVPGGWDATGAHACSHDATQRRAVYPKTKPMRHDCSPQSGHSLVREPMEDAQ